jgi:site-specific DNA recombinase
MEGLKDKLTASELVAELIRLYQAEINSTAKAAVARNGEPRREAEGVARKIAVIMVAIEDGMHNSTLKERMKALEQH